MFSVYADLETCCLRGIMVKSDIVSLLKRSAKVNFYNYKCMSFGYIRGLGA